MPAITVRYFAAARAAAGGLDHDVVTCASPAAALDAVTRTHGPALGTIIDMSSYLLDGVSLDRANAANPVDGPVTVDVLPPFAGG